VPWNQLPANIKHCDLNAAEDFPRLLAKAGLEIYRKRRRNA